MVFIFFNLHIHCFICLYDPPVTPANIANWKNILESDDLFTNKLSLFWYLADWQ